ncbi:MULTISPECIES: M23 family metallopeptidase [unclassified Neisseria]|nr:peptidase M23 [Neisseria sp. HMSC067H09]
MLKMPTKTLLISAVMILFAGCTTKQLPRPNAEIAELRAKEPPAAQSLPNPVKGKRFDDTWGAARSQGRRHEGVDIFAKKNTPIRSTTPGIVTKIGRNRLGGKVIGIQGPGAWHYYAHLNKFASVRLYERVKEGQVIGYVGKTGNAKTTPAHLHYGVYLQSGAINPYPLINQDK